MAKRIGTCVNLDCDNYKKEVEIEAGADFECPLCHQPLKEKNSKQGGGKSGNNGGKSGLIAGIIALIICAGGLGAYFMMSGDETEEPIEVEKTQPMIVSEPVDTAEMKSESVIEKPAKEISAPKVVNGKGSVDLGYATYVGDLKNGKPHGYGTLTYKKSQQIVPSKDYIASPGDTFEGEFRDGRISGLGYWKHDGNQTVVKP